MRDLGINELPPPSSGLLSEVSFRRLLKSCEEITAGDDKGREDLKQWQTSPIFHHYVETLQEMLADLENSERIPSSVRQLYKQHTGTLSDSLKRAEVPEICRLVTSLQVPGRTPAVAAPSVAGAAQPSKMTAPGSTAHLPRAPLPPVAVPKTVPPAPGTAPAPLRPISVSDAAKGRLASNAKAHEALTDDLADMASALKTNTVAMESKLKEREQLLDGTEAALDKSVTGTRDSAARATAAHRHGRMNFCFTFLVIMLIGVGFAAMYIFIRITSITGYRAVKTTVPKAVPVPPHQQPVVDALPDDSTGTHIEL